MKKLILFLLLSCAGAFAQVTVAPFTSPKVQFFDNNGNPLVGGKVCTFSAGTSTPLATYSDLGVTLNANPVVLDSAGRATIYMTSASYKLVIGASTSSSSCLPAITTQDQVTWSTPLSSFSGLTAAGNFDITQPTAATALANQNSFTNCLHGTYWTGSVSADDKWCFSDILGSGSNPTTTLTLTHAGSSGTTAINFPALTFSNPTLTNGTFNGTFAGNPIFSGTPTFGAFTSGQHTFTTLGLNPSTGIPLLSGKNTALTAQQPGFPTEVPQLQQYLENNTSVFYANPQIYLSRFDQTPYTAPGGTPGNGSCLNTGPLGSCDQPMVLIAGTNQNAGSIPGMTGVLVDLWGFAANAAGPPIFADFIAGYGAHVEDQAVPNITNLSGANYTVSVSGNPAQTGPGGFNRRALGQEVDITNNTGNDSVFYSIGGTGNVMLGYTAVSFGNNSLTNAFQISSSSANNKGWQDGIEMGGIINCGICIYRGGPPAGTGFSPTNGIHISESGTNGIVVGSGTITENKSTAGNGDGNPTNGIVIDSKGTAGVSETQNSNTLVINAKNASTLATAWTVSQTGSTSALNFALTGNGTPVTFTSNEVLVTATSPFFQLAGGSSNGRFLSDSTGIGLMSDTSGKTLRFATNNGSSNQWLQIDSAGGISLGTTPHLLIANAAPSIAAGGCGGAAATIATNNGTAAFSVNVGTTPTTACTITMPAAANAWNCYATDITTNSANVFLQKQTATGSTSVTITNFSTAAAATAFTASDILQVSCFAR